MKEAEENGEKNVELVTDSSDKIRTESESQQYLQKGEIIEGKQQRVEDTTIRKEYHNIDENLISKGIERHVIRSHTVQAETSKKGH